MYSAESMHRVARIRTRVLKAGSAGSWFEERRNGKTEGKHAKTNIMKGNVDGILTTQ